MLILICGANGQLGRTFVELSQFYKSENINLLFTDSETLNICNQKEIEEYFKIIFKNSSIDYLINCAAYTQVDRAEKDRESAFAINANAVENLAKICDDYQTTLIHLSTDYVFGQISNQNNQNGKNNLLSEEIPTKPLGIYGASKLAGEKSALQFNHKTYIIRTSWLYSSYGNNFVKTMLKLFKNKEEISVINDQLGSPTYAYDLAQAIMKIIQEDYKDYKDYKNCKDYKENSKYGTYHYSNQGVCSWYEFAEEIKKLTGAKTKIKAVSHKTYYNNSYSNDHLSFAERPLYSALDTHKIRKNFSIEIPFWRESLKNFITKIIK